MKYDELKDEIKAAMKAKDKVRLSILRQVHGEIKNIEVNERRDIEDADVDAMLKRLIKQTRETLDGSIKAGNDQERTDMLTEPSSTRCGPRRAPPRRRTWDASWARSRRKPPATSTKRPPPRSWGSACRSKRPKPHVAIGLRYLSSRRYRSP